MTDQLYLGLPEIAKAMRCSVRKLNIPELKKEMAAKGVIFKRRAGNYGQAVWAAYQSDLIKFQKERAASGKPF